MSTSASSSSRSRVDDDRDDAPLSSLLPRPTESNAGHLASSQSSASPEAAPTPAPRGDAPDWSLSMFGTMMHLQHRALGDMFTRQQEALVAHTAQVAALAQQRISGPQPSVPPAGPPSAPVAEIQAQPASVPGAAGAASAQPAPQAPAQPLPRPWLHSSLRPPYLQQDRHHSCSQGCLLRYRSCSQCPSSPPRLWCSRSLQLAHLPSPKCRHQASRLPPRPLHREHPRRSARSRHTCR